MKTSFLKPLRLLVYFPCYAGNGGYASLSVEVMKWWTKLRREIEADPRIGEVRELYIGDTPITMTRNAAVKAARDNGFDLLMMVDSDMLPDCEIGRDPEAKPFWQTALDFAYERMRTGLPTVIFAPYCGGGDYENPFLFQWQELRNSAGLLDEGCGLTLEAVSRQHAAMLKGIVPMAAGPTGLILYTIDAFECWASSEAGKAFFEYEWKDRTQTEKASTEDVFNTRNHSLGGWEKYGADVVFCACDSWAGHIKNQVVRKPIPVGNAMASAKILTYLQRERAEEQVKLREHLKAQGVSLPEPEPDAPGPVAPAATEAIVERSAPSESPYPYADERLHPSTLREIERLVEHVVEARKRKKGDIVVAYDRDLAVTRIATDALLRRRNVIGDDIRVYYSYGDDRNLAEMDACRKNGPELDKAFQQTGVARKIDSGARPEGLDWDSEPTHLVIDLRTKPYSDPIAKHAYAYLSLVEPLGWRHSESIHYRQDKSVRSVWFGVNADLAEAEAAPDERAEPVAV